MTDRLLDAREVADRLGVPRSWVLESARSGAMPCVRLGRYVRFDLADVEAWLESCKTTRAAHPAPIGRTPPRRQKEVASEYHHLDGGRGGLG